MDESNACWTMPFGFASHHGDYSSWLKIVLKDDEMAELVAELERRLDVSAVESRLLVFDAIRSRYSLPT